MPEASGDGPFFVHNSMPEVGWGICVHSVWSNRGAIGDGSCVNFLYVSSVANYLIALMVAANGLGAGP